MQRRVDTCASVVNLPYFLNVVAASCPLLAVMDTMRRRCFLQPNRSKPANPLTRGTTRAGARKTQGGRVIANERRLVLHDWKDTISEVRVSPGSAETLVRRGGITNHHSIAYSLSNISAKKYQYRLMCIKVCNVIVVFWHNLDVSEESCHERLSHSK